MHCALLSQRYSYVSDRSKFRACVSSRVSLRLCVFRHQVFQPSLLSSCLQWAVLLLLLYTYNRDAGKRERKKRKFSTSFLLPSSRYGRQPETQRRPASHLQSAVVRLVNFCSFAFGFVFIFLGCKLQSVRVYTAGLNCGRWTIWPISVYRCAVGIRDRHKRLVFPNVRNTRPPPLLRPSVRECVRKWRSEMLSGDWPPANNTVSTTAITVQRNNNKLRTQYKKKKKKVSLRMGSFCFPI